MPGEGELVIVCGDARNEAEHVDGQKTLRRLQEQLFGPASRTARRMRMYEHDEIRS